MQALRLLGQQLTKIWHQLGLNQRVIIVLSGGAVLAGLVGLIYWSSRPSFALLYAQLDLMEAGKIITELDQMKIPYQAKGGGSSLYVPGDKVYTVRMQLATKGMPKSEGVGFEIFDKPAFGMSDFVQNANYLRAVQGELQRTIAQIDGVDQARVMIVKPESRLLIDPAKKVTASVFVKLRGNRQLDSSAVNAIRFLVANSVEGLKHNNVSVVDSAGNVLSETSDEGSLASLGTSHLSHKRSVEKYLESKLRAHLDGFLGPNQSAVTISADINNESFTKSDEIYNPDKSLAVPRTETTRVEDTDSTTPQSGGVPGVTTNASTETNSPAFMVMTNHTSKTDKTMEYAVSYSRTNLTRLAGNVDRISASVLVNTNGNPLFPTNAVQAQVDMIRSNLVEHVANALGVELGADSSQLRNVKVTLLSFNKEHEVKLEERLGKDQRSELYWNLGRGALYAVLGLAALVGFWRLVRSSSEELLPTGIPVGQLVGGQLVYESPVGVAGMALPTGVAQAVAEQRVEEVLPEEQEVEELQAAKSKLVMDFGLGQQAPERITIEVLKQLIRENPAKMSQAARSWLSRKMQDSEES